MIYPEEMPVVKIALVFIITAVMTVKGVMFTPESIADDLHGGGIPSSFRDWLPITDADWEVEADEERGIREAVILIDATVFDDHSLELRAQYSRYRRVKVFDEQGIDAYRTMEIPFPAGGRIFRLQARTVKPTGQIIPVDRRDIREKMLLSRGRQEWKAKILAFKGVEPGDIVECYWTEERQWGRIPIVHFRFDHHAVRTAFSWRFACISSLSPSQRSGLGDFYPFNAAWTIMNGRTLGATVEKLPSPERTQWLRVALYDVPPLPDEPLCPAPEEISTYFLGSYRFPTRDARAPFWQHFAELEGEETRSFLGNLQRLDPWMADLLPGTGDLREDAEACLSLIRRDVTNVEEVPEGLLPGKLPKIRRASDLIRNRYGTGVQINALFVGMLRRLGYDATIFWIRDRRHGDYLRFWENPHQFTLSGTAVLAGEEIRWFFPALGGVHSDEIPWYANRAEALLECATVRWDDNPFPLTHVVPIAEADENTIDLQAWLEAEPSGVLRGLMSITWHCRSEPSLEWSALHSSDEETRRRLRRRALQRGLRWRSSDESHSVEHNMVTYACSLEVDDLLTRAGSRWLIDLGKIRPDNHSFPDRERECQIHFRYPTRTRSRLTLKLPAGFRPEELIAPCDLATEWARHRTTVHEDGETIVIERELDLLYNFFRSEGGGLLREFFDSVRRCDEQPIVLSEERSGD